MMENDRIAPLTFARVAASNELTRRYTGFSSTETLIEFTKVWCGGVPPGWDSLPRVWLYGFHAMWAAVGRHRVRDRCKVCQRKFVKVHMSKTLLCSFAGCHVRSARVGSGHTRAVLLVIES
jgi:hypothetical protein